MRASVHTSLFESPTFRFCLDPEHRNILHEGYWLTFSEEIGDTDIRKHHPEIYF